MCRSLVVNVWVCFSFLCIFYAQAEAFSFKKKTNPTKTIASDQSPRKLDCKEQRWLGSQEKELAQEQFASTPRHDLIQASWGELLTDPNESVAPLVLYYLYATESHKPLRQYFKNLAEEIGQQRFTMRGLVARYPIRKDNQKSKRSLQELCTMYEAAYLNNEVSVDQAKKEE